MLGNYIQKAIGYAALVTVDRADEILGLAEDRVFGKEAHKSVLNDTSDELIKLFTESVQSLMIPDVHKMNYDDIQLDDMLFFVPYEEDAPVPPQMWIDQKFDEPYGALFFVPAFFCKQWVQLDSPVNAHEDQLGIFKNVIADNCAFQLPEGLEPYNYYDVDYMPKDVLWLANQFSMKKLRPAFGRRIAD